MSILKIRTINRTNNLKLLLSIAVQSLLFSIFSVNNTSANSLNSNRETIFKILTDDTASNINSSKNYDYNDLATTNILWGANDIRFLQDWLGSFTFISASFENRKDFNNRKWNFLIKNTNNIADNGNTDNNDGINNDNSEYILYLPDDLNIHDLPSIIKRINGITFGLNIPDNWSYIEIKQNLAKIIKYLNSIKTDMNKKKINKTIAKYLQLYQQYFPWDSIDLSQTKWFINNNEYDINKQNNQNLEQIFDSLDNNIITNIHMHFFESFFENGSKLLMDYNWWTSNFSIQDKLVQLYNAKKTKDIDHIIDTEKNILDDLVYDIHNNKLTKDMSYNPELEFKTSIPIDIIKTNIINCVWLSIISKELLEELNIDYDMALEQGHSFTLVTLSDSSTYIFDPLWYDKLIKCNIDWWNWIQKYISYKIDHKIYTTNIITSSDSERFILSQILANKEQSLPPEKVKMRLYILDLSTKMFHKNPFVRYNIAYLNNKLWNYTKSLSAINNALKIYPDYSIFWALKSDIYLNLDDMTAYKFANDMYKKFSK